MNPKKVQATFMNIGASSLLVIFLILCIAIFATLSLSGAKSNYSFSEKMAEHKTNYYNACNQAEAILDEIDTLLADTAASSDTAQDYYVGFTYALDPEILQIPISIAIDHQVPTLSWQIPIDDTQALQVELTVQWPNDTSATSAPGYFYRIDKWQTITINN